MESSIRLLASLCSKEVFVPLSLFLRGVRALRSGSALFSRDFLESCPEFQNLRMKYNRSRLEAISREIEESVAKGHLLLYPGHPLFPAELVHLEEPPYLLRVKGEPVWAKLPGLSIVGHREPSNLSLAWMDQHLSEFLRHQNCFIASGGARGVDQKAHLLALRSGRPTVVLLPSGLENIYPSSLASWVPEILAKGGALVSEYEDNQMMQKHLFAQRNRLISGLGRATLIIEARSHSGTLLTAREALDQSRPLWVLPGHPMDPHCRGGLDLFMEGATPILNASQLSDLFDSEVQGISHLQFEIAKDLVLNGSEGH